ncbi:MAG TPA: DUF1571 domain-containing protein, partial [Phycisphaerae bacterium]|nr:DUF1571 domain-containing protein [Phycisphaerae bacterium]
TRLAVGMLLAALFCIQCTRSDAFRSQALFAAISNRTEGRITPEQLKHLEKLAREDHVALLKLALAHYDKNYRDYTCTFIKQERISGKLKEEQWIGVKFMDRPFSVAMTWTRNAPIGDRVLYVEGQHDGQMLVRPKGFLFKLVGTQMREPDGPAAMANTLRPVTMFGFRRSLESLLEVYETAEGRGEANCRFLGYRKIAGRHAMVLERVLPPREDYPAKTTTWYLDTQTLVLLGLEGTDWDDRLLCSYLYKDIEFNVGLAAADFAPAANGMPLKE